MDNPKQLTVLSLCAGYGGLELGLARALENPLRVVAVEIEAYALANLVKAAEKQQLAIEALYPDLKTFPAERFSGCFDIITAGYPCQPFSVAGKRRGTEDPRHLWPHIERIIETVRPVWFFGENVLGHLTLGFPEVYCSLRDMGYLVEATIYGRRLFVLAASDCVWELQPKGCKPDERRRAIHGVEEEARKIPDDGRSRAANGPRNRVDRLRLCGNGVIPHQAERAFRELI